jgi:hypothetical protein
MEGRGWSGVPNVVQKELALEGFKEDCEKIVDRLQKVFRVPSRECDPSDELREILEDASGEIREEVITSLEELITIASKIAPEYVRATYGDEERRIPPSELYEKTGAEPFKIPRNPVRLQSYFWMSGLRKRKERDTS